MSQYIHIFVRSDKDEFVPIHCSNRGSVIYDTFSVYAPYEKIAPVTADILDKVDKDIRCRLKEYQDGIDKYEKKIELVSRMAGTSADERLEHINDYMDTIKECREDMEQLERASQYVTFLRDILDEKECDVSYYDGRDIPVLYMGIECGTQVSLKDIKE